MLLENFKEKGQYEIVPAGSVITQTVVNKHIQSIYWLEEGVAALSSITEKGDKQTFQYFVEPGFLNLIPYLTRQRLNFENNQEVNVVAKSDCRVCKFPVSFLNKQMENSAFLRLCLDTVLRDYTITMDKIGEMKIGSSLSHLCRFILKFAQVKEGGKCLNKVFTYPEIASFFRIHEVSVARMVKTLKETGLVEKQGGELVVLDELRLKKLAIDGVIK